MKDITITKENVGFSASGKSQNVASTAKYSTKSLIMKGHSRQPLHCKTNTLENANHISSRQDEKRKKTKNKLGLRFAVCEDQPATVEVSVGRCVDAATQTAGAASAAATGDGGATRGAAGGGGTSAASDAGAASGKRLQATASAASVETDLCSEAEPSTEYWRALAATRQRALEVTLTENQKLHEQVQLLERENALLQEVLQRAEDVVSSVQDWTEEQTQ